MYACRLMKRLCDRLEGAAIGRREVESRELPRVLGHRVGKAVPDALLFDSPVQIGQQDLALRGMYNAAGGMSDWH